MPPTRPRSLDTLPRLARAVRRAVCGRAAALLTLAAGAALAAPAPAAAQWSRVYEQFYLQAPHNWVFRRDYQGADRLFNAFDYGHAILYEKLWTRPDAPPSLLEEKEYDYLTKKVLVRPPRVPLEEGAIEIRYVQLAPEAKAMFEWAHILHRQLYDVLADERLDPAAKDREVQRLVDYYKSRPDVAFSSKPKSMKLMQEQPYSLAFRQQYPKFNGLIWAYHWLQVGLYEPLVVGTTVAQRQGGVRATTARFWQMLQDPPRTFPYQMPMTPAVAPAFAARFQEAAIIFDNLHSMHDVISDILANDAVPRDRKRAEILLAARRFRDDTSYVMTPQAWLAMSAHMGVENMGGPSVGFQTALPTPTVTYGAVMTHDDRTGQMAGFKYGQATGGGHAGGAHGGGSRAGMAATDPTAGAPGANAHAGHGAAPGTPGGATGATATQGPAHQADHSAMGHGPAAPSNGAPTGMGGGPAGGGSTADMHVRMMADPVIRQRVMGDTAMHRLLMESMQRMPAEHRAHMQAMMHGGGHGDASGPPPSTRQNAPTDGAGPATRPATPRSSGTRRQPAARPANSPATRPPADPHAGHGPPPAARTGGPARRPAPAERPAPRDATAGMDHGKHQTPRP